MIGNHHLTGRKLHGMVAEQIHQIKVLILEIEFSQFLMQVLLIQLLNIGDHNQVSGRKKIVLDKHILGIVINDTQANI